MKNFAEEIQEILNSPRPVIIVTSSIEKLCADIEGREYYSPDMGVFAKEMNDCDEDEDDCDCEDCSQDFDPEDFSMGFETALLSMKEGYSVKRAKWSEDATIFIRNSTIFWEPKPEDKCIYKYEATMEDIMATDWNIVHHE